MHFIRTNIVTILILLLVIALVSYFAIKTVLEKKQSTDSAFSQIQVIDEGGLLPYTDLDGNVVDLNQYAGKPLVINAWATWCPFCVNELPDLGNLKSEFGDAVEVIAINRMESSATAKAFVNHVGNPDGIIFLQDKGDRFYKSIGGFSMPETIFYDSAGNVSTHKRGSMSFDEMRRLTEVIVNSDK